MTDFQTREVTHIRFKDWGSIEVLNLEKLILTFEAKAKSQDIGALCYLSRAVKSTQDQGIGRPVDLYSLDKKRKPQIKALIDTLFDHFSHNTETTINSKISRFISFIDWSDNVGMTDVLSGRNQAKRAFKAYLQNIKDRVRRGNIKKNTACIYQNQSLEVLKAYFDDETLDEGIALIKNPGNSGTRPQDEAHQGYVLAWCQALFDDFSDLVLNEKPYPCQLSVPKITGWDVDFLWVFATNTMIMPPHVREQRESLKLGSWAYDYTNGKLFQSDEIANKYIKKYTAVMQIKKAQQVLKNANEDMHHYQRRRAASIASQAFLQLFYANTGQNQSGVELMIWSDNYDVVQSRQGFRVIKNRGHKGPVLFEIELTFLDAFKKYLKLRQWILNGQKTNLLFFSTGRYFDSHPSVWTGTTLGLNRWLKSLDPAIPKFSSRQWRANKSQFVNENADLATAAVVLNHSIEVHKKSYSEGTEGQAAEQLSQFFDGVIKAASQINASAKDNSLGQCSDYGHPDQLDSESAMIPDCHQPEGCLFCKHYYLHVDEKDIRKLASCRYVMSTTEHLSASPEHHAKVFTPIITRIDGLLETMRQRGENEVKLVNQVVEEVQEEEELSAYWENELQMLIDLGLAS